MKKRFQVFETIPGDPPQQVAVSDAFETDGGELMMVELPVPIMIVELPVSIERTDWVGRYLEAFAEVD
jgi:hypothetical protein